MKLISFHQSHDVQYQLEETRHPLAEGVPAVVLGVITREKVPKGPMEGHLERRHLLFVPVGGIRSPRNGGLQDHAGPNV